MHPIVPRRLVAAPLLALVLGLGASGCAGDDPVTSDSSSDSSSAGTAAPDEEPGAADDVLLAEAKELDGALAGVNSRFEDARASLMVLVRRSTDTGAAATAQRDFVAWQEEASAFEGDLGAAAIDLTQDDEAVAAAFEGYRTQATALLGTQATTLNFYASYAGCTQTLGLNLLQRDTHARSVDRCVASLAGVQGSPIPGLDAYAESMTVLMDRRRELYADFGRAAAGIELPDPERLDPDELRGAGDAFGELNEEVERIYTELDTAYADDVEPTVTPLTRGGGLERALQDASPDADYAELVAAVGSADD